MKVIVFEPNKDPEVREVPDGNDAFPTVANIIGDELMVINSLNTYYAYIDGNVDAHFKGASSVHNPIATFVISTILKRYGRIMRHGDQIANTMVVVGVVNANGEVDGNWHDLRQEDMDDLLEVAKAAKLFIK